MVKTLDDYRQELKIYNSLTGKKETFEPLVPGHVGMYVCGPTVYSHVHLGNVRTFVSFDVIYRYLKHLGFKVRYVRNITDAGHLEDNSDEDKIKLVQKTSSISLTITKYKYFLKLKVTIPFEYPQQRIQ